MKRSETNAQIEAQKRSLTGTKVNNYTLTELYYVRRPKSARFPMWKCVCECGNIKHFSHYHIFSNKIQRCEKCMPDSRSGANSCNWSGYGELPGTLFSSIERGAKSRLLEYSVSREYLWNLFLTQNRRCALSGVKLIISCRSTSRNGNISLDRIDNSKGYVEGNVRWVTKDINLMRRLLDDTDFIEYCRCVVEFNINKNITESYLSDRYDNKLKSSDNPNDRELRRIRLYEKTIKENKTLKPKVDFYNSQSVVRVDIKTGEEKEYKSIKLAERSNGLCRTAINKVISGRNKTAGGFFWRKNSDCLLFEI